MSRSNKNSLEKGQCLLAESAGHSSNTNTKTMKKTKLLVFLHPWRKTFKILLTMKIFLLLTSVFALTIHASVLPQGTKMSIEVENQTIRQVIQEIEAKSEYRFFYNDRLADLDERVDFKVEDITEFEAIEQLLVGQDLAFELMENNLVLIMPASIALQQTLTGTITDSEGNPIPGVNIIVKGTTQGSISDANGKYTINVDDPNATLVFSFIGFTSQEVQVGNQTTINITLAESAIGLDEVVVVGYGTMKKADLTGAVVKADIEAFKEAPNVNILKSLQGSVPGLNIGMTTTAGSEPLMSIRGQNSISGSNNPLIVLDGIIYNGQLVDINPDDIESVDILKDISSTAIYGSRAANGVILLTTKKGKRYDKPMITYSGYVTIQNPYLTLTPKNREEYINKIGDVYWEEAYLGPDYTEPNPSWDPVNKMTKEGTISGYEKGYETDWLDLMSQQSYIQNHNLSIRGSNNQTSYFLSTSISDEHGFIINDTYKRWNTRINLENKITEWMKIGIQSFVNSSDYSGVSPMLRDGYLMPPVAVPYDENGDLIKQPVPPIYNPLLNIQNDDLDKRFNLFGNFYTAFDILPIEGLTYRINFSNNYRTDRKYNFNPNGATYQGSGYKTYGNYLDWTFDNIFSYQRIFNEVHELNATLVFGWESREGEGTNATSAIFGNMDLGYNFLEGGEVEKQLVSTNAWEEFSLYNMGRVNYKYNNKYLFTGTIRRDGFSGFGEDKKIGYFPSGAFAWVIGEENFVKDNVNWLNYLKLRLSYGLSGNRTIGRYSTMAKVYSDYVYLFGDGSSPVTGQSIISMENNSLFWEPTLGLNIGADFGVLNNRIRGFFEYYQTSTTDLIYRVNIPYATGFNSVLTNIGEIQNNGLEFSVITENIKKSNFHWQSTFNFSRNKNEVVSILGYDDDDDGVEDDLISSGIFIGEPLGSIYDYHVEGIYQLDDEDIPSGYFPGTYIVRDISGPEGEKDGLITEAHDRDILGYASPAYRFSIQNTFEYKNWTFRVFIHSIQGGKNGYLKNNRPQDDGAWNNSVNISGWNTVNEWDYWTPRYPGAEYRRLDRFGAIDPNIYRQRSFIRLQDVSLAYNFNNTFLGKSKISNLKLYISGKNLYTWTKWVGLDPETGSGIKAGGFPVLRSYTFGVELSF